MKKMLLKWNIIFILWDLWLFFSPSLYTNSRTMFICAMREWIDVFWMEDLYDAKESHKKEYSIRHWFHFNILAAREDFHKALFMYQVFFLLCSRYYWVWSITSIKYVLFKLFDFTRILCARLFTRARRFPLASQCYLSLKIF